MTFSLLSLRRQRRSACSRQQDDVNTSLKTATLKIDYSSTRNWLIIKLTFYRFNGYCLCEVAGSLWFQDFRHRFMHWAVHSTILPFARIRTATFRLAGVCIHHKRSTYRHDLRSVQDGILSPMFKIVRHAECRLFLHQLKDGQLVCGDFDVSWIFCLVNQLLTSRTQSWTCRILGIDSRQVTRMGALTVSI